MKKIILTAAAFMASASVFAEGFNLSGYLRAGYSSTFGDNATQNTSTWLAGDYWGGRTRSRINVNWDSKDNTSGAEFRYQYTGDIESFSFSGTDIKFADVYARILDGKVLVKGGKLNDSIMKTDGFEGFSLIDNKSGVVGFLTPTEGLYIGGGAIVDYKEATVESITFPNTVYDSNGNDAHYHTNTTTISTSDKYTDKQVAVFGGKYTTDAFSVCGGYSPIGACYAGLNITAVKDLLIALEGGHETDDCQDEQGDYLWYHYENTFCEQVEYTGIDHFTFGIMSYQLLNSREPADDTKSTITITPAVSYAINKTVAVACEGTYVMYSYDDHPDNYGYIVPSITFAADDSASVKIWGLFSSDQTGTFTSINLFSNREEAKNCMGVGLIKNL